MVIWANHNLRAALAAMRKVSRRIMAEESLAGIEDEIASIQDVFALTGESELALAERFYLPARAEDTGEVEAAAAPRRAAA
jgi:phosphoenolpyruvate phosphomutase